MPEQTDQLITEIIHNLGHIQHLQLAGGEPFLMPGVGRIISEMVATGHAQHCDLEITTNGTHVRPQWLEDWLPRFRSVVMAVSCDAVGDLAEYVRWPLKWSKWSANMHLMRSWSKAWPNCQLTLGVTVSACTVKALPELWRWHSDLGITAYYDVVRSPQWLMPSRAPDDIKHTTLRWIRSLPAVEAKQTGLITNVASALTLKANHQARLIHQQHEGIRYLNAHRPITWAEAIPELRDWQPPQQ